MIRDIKQIIVIIGLWNIVQCECLCIGVFGCVLDVKRKKSTSTAGAHPSNNRIRKPLTGLNFMKKNGDHVDADDDKGKIGEICIFLKLTLIFQQFIELWLNMFCSIFTTTFVFVFLGYKLSFVNKKTLNLQEHMV